MRIGVVGLGYVGLVTAAVLADKGHDIIGVDIDQDKLQKLREEVVPFYEPGLKELLIRNKEKLHFSNSYDSLSKSEVVFLCVPTPDRDGKINLDYVLEATKLVGEKSPNSIKVIKSTVTPGTAKLIRERTGIDVVSNPEFLKEGSAINDTLHPDRIIVGGSKSDVYSVAELWSFCEAPLLITSNENAELIKYASNSFLAVKISFINEMADLCQRVPNADVSVIAEGMGLDRRIGKDFLRAGLGFGGSCFPKDTKALVSYAEEQGVDLSIVKAAIGLNEVRVNRTVENLVLKFGDVKSKNVCILGLSFKANTDDVRYSKPLELAMELRRRGAKVRFYDPVVPTTEDFEVGNDPQDCIDGSDIAIVASEWEEFPGLDYSKTKCVVDFRGVLSNEKTQFKVGVWNENH